jgi:hypothetical protein
MPVLNPRVTYDAALACDMAARDKSRADWVSAREGESNLAI